MFPGFSSPRRDEPGNDRRGSPRCGLPLPAVDWSGSDGPDVRGLRALLALLLVELHALVLVQAAVAVAGDGGVVDEEVLTTVVRGDEPEALFGVEPLHRALRHCGLSFSSRDEAHTVCNPGSCELPGSKSNEDGRKRAIPCRSARSSGQPALP